MRKALADHEVLAWIEGYAQCELSLEQLCSKIRNLMGKRFIHNEKMRVVNLNQVCPQRAVRITPQHIETLFAKRGHDEITEQAMVDWAHMVIINDAYFWEPEDADTVGRSVNFLFFDFKPQVDCL